MPNPHSLSPGTTRGEAEQNGSASQAVYNWNSIRNLAEQKLDQLGRYIRGAYSCEEDEQEYQGGKGGKQKYRGL
jgi:hypothetical protein